MTNGITRRHSLGLIGAGAAAFSTIAARAAADPFDGEAMYRAVAAFDALGEHRTATEVDAATTGWLEAGLQAAGLTTERQAFASALFTPGDTHLAFAQTRIATFPAWPPVATPPEGIRGELALPDDDVSGRIVVIDFPYSGAARWSDHGLGTEVDAAFDKGARGAVVVTDGPTGEIIALNIAPGFPQWAKPLALAAGRDGAVLKAAASARTPATLVNAGSLDRGTRADNVIGRRARPGQTVVVTTPKSGWFRCAGERGTGIALFLAISEWIVRETACDLLVGCSSGHELDFLGSRHFFERYAPPPDKVKLWLHIGANAAVQATSVGPDGIEFLGRPGDGRLTISETLLPQAKAAFAGLPGYETPVVFNAHTAIGEFEVFRKGGYANVVGMVGAWPLFHTRADRAAVATTPAVLKTVGLALRQFMKTELT